MLHGVVNLPLAATLPDVPHQRAILVEMDVADKADKYLELGFMDMRKLHTMRQALETATGQLHLQFA